MSKKYRVAIKIGHTEKAKGAFCKELGVSEFPYNLDVAKELLKFNDTDNICYDIYTFDANISSYTKRQQKVAEVLNRTDYDLVIELHFNSAESNTAQGTCVLYFRNSIKGKRASEIIGDQISEDFGTERDPDVGLSNTNQNGYQAVSTPKAVAILLEPFFGSNPLESRKFKDVAKYAKSIHKGVQKYFTSF